MPAEGMPEYAIAQSDEFQEDKLGLQWQWQANPNPDNYSLAGHKGLRLFCRANEGRRTFSGMHLTR